MKSFFFILLFILFPIISYSQCGSCNRCNETRVKSRSGYIESAISKGSTSSDSKKFENTNKQDDEFEEFSDFSEDNEIQKKDLKNDGFKISNLWTLLIVFTAVIFSGIFVRFKQTRHFRVLFLVGFLIYLGFYLGGCPCPISSFQNVILSGFGASNGFDSMIYFLGLIPLTYFFGKVWCGWICHLGSLQEFLHIHRKFKFLRSQKAQMIMKTMRIILFLVLITQLAITKTNWFCKIDPFLVSFNFISAYQIGWYLLGLLILTSVFIHRPFCQAACPIGLVLGIVSKIPGARKLNYNDNCTSCNICNDSCKIGAISKSNGENKINSIECNFCGECLDSCTKDAINFKHR
jgi:polyferredoxin